jgi:hypothetical protein
MGMTISVVLVNLKETLKIELIQENNNENNICHETLKTAFDLVCKYWKITEIVKDANANELGFEYVGEKIIEVVNGNDD